MDSLEGTPQPDPNADDSAPVEAPLAADQPGMDKVDAAIATPGDPPALQVTLRFLTNTKGMVIEAEYPPNTEPDERNVAHVLAWYIANAGGELLPVAINSWHAQRLLQVRSAQEQAAVNDASKAIVAAAETRILGADSKPLDLAKG